MIKIALLGYGRMGKTLDQLSTSQNMEVIVTFNSQEDWKNNIEKLQEVDVAIDFSTPETAFYNIARCFDYNIPVVSGTTGWLDQLDEVKKRISKENQSFLYGSNFSLGMQVFFKINKKLSQFIQPEWNYKITMEEAHHIHKVDKPSGTAISIAEQIIENQKYTGWSIDQPNNEQIPINVIREGEIKGFHEVKYENSIDEITISHNAKTRDGFALGALACAKWLVDKNGFFTVENYIDSLMKKANH